MALNLLNRLAIGSSMQSILQRHTKDPNISTRLMSKKQNGKKDAKGPKDNKCGDNQFFGGCFKKEPEFKCSDKKEKTKQCQNPCKDGPCRQSRK